jgi:hypothetical protein
VSIPVLISCAFGFVLYVVVPPFIDLIYNDTYLEGEFSSSYHLFYTCVISLFTFIFLLLRRRFTFHFLAVESFYSFVGILFLVKAICIAIDIPTGVYFTGERNRLLPLGIASIVDIMFLTAFIHLERSDRYKNRGLFLAVIFILFRFVEMFYVDGSRRGLLFAIWPFLFYAYIKLPFMVSIFLGAFIILFTLVGLTVYGAIRNGGNLSDGYSLDIQYLDFFNIYQANLEVHNYIISMAGDANVYNGVTYLKVFFVGMFNAFDIPSSPVSVFVADVVYDRPEMTINPGMFGEALVNFGIYYCLALLPLGLYFFYISVCSFHMKKSAFSIMLLAASSFLIWRGQFESCIYITLPVFLNMIFDNSKRNKT